MSERPLEVLYHHWRAVIAAQKNPSWERTFALSIQRKRRDPNFTPSPRQLAVMRQMVADLFINSGETAELIEQGG